MIDAETAEYVLRQFETRLVNSLKKLEGCGENSQSYKHGYREGYKDCAVDLQDFLEDLVNGYIDDESEKEAQ